MAADAPDLTSLARPEKVLRASVYVDQLIASLRGRGDAIVARRHGRDTTARQLLELIFRYANALDGCKVSRGSVVALIATNTAEALALRYAVSLLGAASTYLAVPRSVAQLQDLIDQVDPTLLVAFPETAHLVPSDTTVPIASIGECKIGGSVDLDRAATSERATVIASRAGVNDLGVLVCSGGSTGVPKSSWRSFAAYNAMLQAPTSNDRRQLINGPLAYLSQVLVDITLIGGGLVVLDDQFDAARTLATIEAERITNLFLVEPQLFEMMDHPDVQVRDLSSLRAITHVGGSAPPTLRRRARERLGPVIAHNYGASEMGIVSSLAAGASGIADAGDFSSAGPIVPGVEIRFRRSDGSLATVAEAGVIEVRSAAMANGYRAGLGGHVTAFDEGWFHSGDLGILDERDFLHVLGRAADIAWVDDTMVSPLAIEEALCQLSTVRYAVAIRDAATAGWIAAAEPWPGIAVDLSVCRAALAQAFRGAEIEIIALERVPRTEQGKADRAAIARLAQDGGK